MELLGPTNLPTFPIDDTERRVVVPGSIKNPDTGTSIRGVEGLRSAVIEFPRTVVVHRPAVTPEISGWQPLAAGAAIQRVPVPGRSTNPIGIDGFDRVSWWLSEIASDMPGPPTTYPPSVIFSIRACANCGRATEFANVKILAGAWTSGGLIVQVSGVLASQWEMWAQVQEDMPLDTKVKLRITGIFDRSSGGTSGSTGPGYVYGPLVIDHTP